jgi:hypothetical protein
MQIAGGEARGAARRCRSAPRGGLQTSLVLLCMLVMASSVAPAREPGGGGLSVPERLWECERNGERNDEACGTWTFHGTEGSGRWQTGAMAELTVQQFDPMWIIIRRSDPVGPSAGLIAIYRGRLDGDRVEGTVTWTWVGHWDHQVEGTWYATFGRPRSSAPPPPPAPPTPVVPLLAPPEGGSQPDQVAPPGGRVASAVRIADQFLKTARLGREILQYLHFGTAYHGHDLLRVVDLPEEQQYMLVYRYRWADDGVTDVGFLCDRSGQVQHVEVMSTNALLSQPFFAANLSRKILGAVIVEELKDKMSKWERKSLEWLIENADAHMLLEWRLRLGQSVR